MLANEGVCLRPQHTSSFAVLLLSLAIHIFSNGRKFKWTFQMKMGISCIGVHIVVNQGLALEHCQVHYGPTLAS